MTDHDHPTPRHYLGVMVSSTFTDLTQHRAVLIRAINGQGLHEVAMENDSAKPIDVIDSSLQMVRDAAAYIGVISHKYGQTPPCQQRNPDHLSITELEFNEAQRLERPVLLFIMGNDHPVRKADVENESTKQKQLDAFRERAKQMSPSAPVHRVYATFDSVEDFSQKAIQAVAGLRRHFDEKAPPLAATQFVAPSAARQDPIPPPPALYAEPPYIGSHKFVGRQSELDTLNDWAAPADSHPVMLFEAIGGAGKSILTWEWTTRHAPNARNAWTGRFWYSFYQKGATMVDFCRRALAYMTRHPRASFRERNTAELREPLIHHLQANPWLLVLDGLERVLVSYHRFDAAQVRDEDAGTADAIARRDPCAAINPEDDDLLRALAAAGPSKVLITSRLVPRVLLNPASQPIPGVLRVSLHGLRPTDAEALFRSCGVSGDSQSIQNYLKSHCDCHPLVVGVLAGLVNDYLPDRGNFDAWAADPSGGGQLNLAELDLLQKRNHILASSLAALPETSRQLLSTLALLSGSVDYATVCALNPSLSPVPEVVQLPKHPEQTTKWRILTESEQVEARERYAEAVRRYREYEQALAKREVEMREAAHAFPATVRDLERRGLLQYDVTQKRYDLHPVVRGIAAGGLKHDEKNTYGQRVVDHFSQQAQDPYDQAESLEDFDSARHIVKVLFQMGKPEEARRFLLNSSFLQALNSRFEAHNEILAIVRPFFSAGWNTLPDSLATRGGIQLAKRAATALRRIGAFEDALDVSLVALRSILDRDVDSALCSQLLSIASTVGEQNQLAQEARLLDLARAVELARINTTDRLLCELAWFRYLSILGNWAGADSVWLNLSQHKLPIGSNAVAAHHYAVNLFFRGRLNEAELASAEEVNRSARSALGCRNLCALRGLWRLELNEPALARDSLNDAVVLARKAGKTDRRSEIRLALAKHRLKELHDPRRVAEDLTYGAEQTCSRALAELWIAIGDPEEAKKNAIAAFKWASSDGEPFVHRYELEKTSALLKQLNVALPAMPTYDATKGCKFPLEDSVATVIERLRREGEPGSTGPAPTACRLHT